MVLGLPLAHIPSYFADNRHRHHDIDAIDLGQVRTGHAEQLFPQVKLWIAFLLFIEPSLSRLFRQSGPLVAVTLQAADLGDTATLDQTLSEAGMAVAELVKREAGEQRPEDTPKVNVELEPPNKAGRSNPRPLKWAPQARRTRSISASEPSLLCYSSHYPMQ
jgi:hypothetical protein